MMTKLLGLLPEHMAAEMISKKNKNVYFLPSGEDGQTAAGIGVDLQRKIKSLRLQFMGAGPYGVYMHRYYSTSFDLQTHY